MNLHKYAVRNLQTPCWRKLLNERINGYSFSTDRRILLKFFVQTRYRSVLFQKLKLNFRYCQILAIVKIGKFDIIGIRICSQNFV